MLKWLIEEANSPWTTALGEQADVVLSSRIRLARNFDQYPFPLKQTQESGPQVLAMMSQFALQHQGFAFYDLQQVRPLEKQVLVEKHYMSPAHSKENGFRGLVLDDCGTVSIMVNEEDHLRIQCFAPGLDLQRLWQKASVLDDQIEQNFDYAFSQRWGYLTSCPTNLGNGLRGSVMVHLPGLAMTKRLKVLDQLSHVGMTVRGLFGEGSQASGNLFQLSNQITLGQSEEDMIDNLTAVVQQIVKEERQSRLLLRQHYGIQLEDQVWRALGILSHSRCISGAEALQLISQLRLGHSLGYLEHLSLEQINQLYLFAQGAYLQVLHQEEMDSLQRDQKRAEEMRRILA